MNELRLQGSLIFFSDQSLMVHTLQLKFYELFRFKDNAYSKCISDGQKEVRLQESLILFF